ncbi:MAG: 2,3,4,5-tetrahydropyridine-2,6-dicarboxylate N-succinyltransferase, partial [Parasphingorhabdus sp.]
MTANLIAAIETAWDKRESLNINSQGEERDAVNAALASLDNGSARVAEKQGDKWVVNQWLKKAVLLYFRIERNAVLDGTFTNYYDKVPLKLS